MHTETVKYVSLYQHTTSFIQSIQQLLYAVFQGKQLYATRFARTSRGPFGLNIRWYSINKFEIVLITAVIVTSMKNP